MKMDKLESGMLLYHGSYTKITRIDLNICAQGKDFGSGFYLSDDLEQAKSFIPRAIQKAVQSKVLDTKTKQGFVSVYRYTAPKKALSYYEFSAANREWLWFVSLNRRKALAEFLTDKIPSELNSAEIIVGKIANDTTNPTITAWLNGLYGSIQNDRSADIAIELLLPNRLKEQYCFKTQTAVNCLTLEEIYAYDV